jgi:hypothetical protein
MLTFKRIKIQATVETEPKLVPEDEIDGALDTLRDRLKQLDLVILSIEPKEVAPIEPSEPSRDDPWSMRGQPVG